MICSVEKGYTGKVLLNGIEVKYAFMCATSGGIVWVHKTDKFGRVIINSAGDDTVKERLRGDVRYEPSILDAERGLVEE